MFFFCFLFIRIKKTDTDAHIHTHTYAHAHTQACLLFSSPICGFPFSSLLPANPVLFLSGPAFKSLHVFDSYSHSPQPPPPHPTFTSVPPAYMQRRTTHQDGGAEAASVTSWTFSQASFIKNNERVLPPTAHGGACS